MQPIVAYFLSFERRILPLLRQRHALGGELQGGF
jgi:hypothetical protein